MNLIDHVLWITCAIIFILVFISWVLRFLMILTSPWREKLRLAKMTPEQRAAYHCFKLSEMLRNRK